MKRFFIALIRFYQKHLSGRKKHPTCLYTPTCSCYALEAFEKRGAFVGLALSVWRLLRCNPFSRGGYDPVPDKGFGRKIKYRDMDRLAAQMRARGEMTFQYDNEEATGGTESAGGRGSFESGPSQDLAAEEANAECQKGSLPPRPDTAERQEADCGAVPSEDQPERHQAKQA